MTRPLALDAYFALAGKNPSAKDPQIIALSHTLRALPYHGEAARKPTFRNPEPWTEANFWSAFSLRSRSMARSRRRKG